MERDICFIENLEDINLIEKKLISKKLLFVPLNLESFLYCKKKNFEIFNFKENIDNNFHKNTLKLTKEFLEKLKFKRTLHYSLKAEIIFFLRFRLNSILFIIEIIDKIKKKFYINQIIVSGLKKKFHRNLHDGNIVTEIIEELYKGEIKIKKLSSDQADENEPIYKIKYICENAKFDKKNVLMSNVGYNFYRIIEVLKKNKINVWVPFFEDISIIKKIVYYLRGFKPLQFKKIYSEDKLNDYIEKINYSYKFHNLSSLLNNFYNKLIFYFNEVEQKSLSLKKTINENNFSLTISNIVKGFNGSILDNDVNCKTLCVSHGIIARSNNEYDEIYKKIIAQAVFSGESKYFAIQSKIMEDSLNTHNLKGKKLITGNIVFSSSQKIKKNNIYVVQASTLKDFSNLQFLGVEMFYEYWEALSKLNNIAKKDLIKIIVKPHPTIKKCTSELRKNFNYLKFSDKSISKLLTKSSLLISFSSSVIEDALNSFVPVILFDLSKRYNHIGSVKKLDYLSAINYTSLERELVEILKNSRIKKITNFDNFVFRSEYQDNIKKNILNLI